MGAANGSESMPLSSSPIFPSRECAPRRASPWTVRSLWPAPWTAPRAFPRERDESPRARIRPLASRAPCPPPCHDVRVSASPSPASHTSSVRVGCGQLHLLCHTRRARPTVATASTQRRRGSRMLFTVKPVVRQQHHAIARIARASGGKTNRRSARTIRFLFWIARDLAR
jgi:hypothetical protein